MKLAESSPSFVSRQTFLLWEDVASLAILLIAIALLTVGLHEATSPLPLAGHDALTLSVTALPDYALRTILRMLAGMVASLTFTFTYATLAAKSLRAERILVPILDILQSVPILGYLSFSVAFFVGLFPGSVFGPELAAIFAIFTSQAWNMAFSFYQALRMIPNELDEASRSFRASAWQRFWRLEVPFAMPGLIWNMMMSMSGGWFFVVAAEAISVGDLKISLPGIGSYVALAIEHRDLGAVFWAIATMTVVILLYDQLAFRPLVAWADKFRSDQTASQVAPRSWVLDVYYRSRLLGRLILPFKAMLSRLARMPLRVRVPSWFSAPQANLVVDVAWYGLVACACAYGAFVFFHLVAHKLSWDDVRIAVLDGLLTMSRVFVLVAAASIVWVPVGVYVGLRPRMAERIQPISQFLAAFPANLLFPVVVVIIVRFNLAPSIWLWPIMILGTQWYILFNIVAGASNFPKDLEEAAATFRVRAPAWWRKVILPGILPFYITGAITASGGAWNASIVSETVSWGSTRLTAGGLGAYIAQMTEAGDYPRIALGVAVMSLFVVVINRLIWRPLYGYAEQRTRLT